MFPVSNHTSCETSTNTVKTSNPSAAKLVSDTRIVMRSISPQPTPHLSPTNSADLHLSDAPLLGTMKFNEEQKAFWKTHTRPEVSSKVQKLVMLRTIAHDQEKAGLHFDGRRSFAQAEVDLLQEQLIQTSQAARVQNPLKVIGEAAKNLAQSLGNYFEGMPSIEEAVNEYSKPIENTKYKVQKSTALETRLAAGETISNFAIGLVDSKHDSNTVRSGLKAFIARHFKPERGDILLKEAVFVIDTTTGKEILTLPKIEKNHKNFCMGVPVQSCRFLPEPENEIHDLGDAIAKKRTLVIKMFEFLMNSIPAPLAFKARESITEYNSKISYPDTEYKIEIMLKYQNHCDPAKEKRWSLRLDQLAELNANQEKAIEASSKKRDQTYFHKIYTSTQEMKPGAILFYQMGRGHFRELQRKLNGITGIVVEIDESATTAKKEEL